jgi:hypothetical protein
MQHNIFPVLHVRSLIGKLAPSLFRSVPKLIARQLLGTALKRMATEVAHQLRALWAGRFSLQVGDTVSWNGGHFSILEKRGAACKLADIRGINPWLLPALPFNPKLLEGKVPFWYKGSRLKKTGHPELKISVRSPHGTPISILSLLNRSN